MSQSFRGKKNVNETCCSSEINHSLFIFTVTSERRKSLKLLNAVVCYNIYIFQLNLSSHAPTLIVILTAGKKKSLESDLTVILKSF